VLELGDVFVHNSTIPTLAVKPSSQKKTTQAQQFIIHQ